MTGINDFDQALETWLRHQAPSQAPDRVLDAALERVGSASQRRSWLQRLLGGTPLTMMVRTAAAAAVIAVATIFGVQLINPTPNVGPSPVPSPSTRPTEAATPSSPAKSAEAATPSPKPSPVASPAALAVQLVGGGEEGPYHVITILADGRLITGDPRGPTAPMERRLTMAGMQLVLDEIAATGLTDTNANFSPVAKPGVEPPGAIGDLGQLEIHQAGGDTVVIGWNLYNDGGAYYLPQPEAEALEALKDRLSTAASWLPALAWADASAVPYVPAAYRMTIYGQAWGGSADALRDIATMSWPVDFDRTDLAEVLASTDDEARCRLVDAAAGTALIEALRAAGATPPDEPYLSFWLGANEGSRLIETTLVPLLPFDIGTC